MTIFDETLEGRNLPFSNTLTSGQDLIKKKNYSICSFTSEVCNDFNNPKNILCSDQVAEPLNRKTTMSTRSNFRRFQNLAYRTGLSSLAVLDDNILTTCFGFTFTSVSPFYETFTEKIGQMISSGLYEKWQGEHDLHYERSKIVKLRNEEVGPQVLTLDHLCICFQLWLIPLTLSFVVFLYEVLNIRVRQALKDACRKFIETLTAVNVIQAFVRMRVTK